MHIDKIRSDDNHFGTVIVVEDDADGIGLGIMTHRNGVHSTTSVILRPASVRRLIDALEPHAEPSLEVLRMDTSPFLFINFKDA